MTSDEIDALWQNADRQVGHELADPTGRRFWITDVLPDERIRVVGEDGRVYWWNESNKFATAITPAKSKQRSGMARFTSPLKIMKGK